MESQQRPIYISRDDRRELENTLLGCPLCGYSPYHILSIQQFNRDTGVKFLLGYEVKCYDCKIKVGMYPSAVQARDMWNLLSAKCGSSETEGEK